MIDRQTLRHVAALARLELTSDEEARLTRELARVVEMVEELPEVDPLAEASGGAGMPEPERLAAGAGTSVQGDRPACVVPLDGFFERNAPVVEEGHLRLPPVRREAAEGGSPGSAAGASDASTRLGSAEGPNARSSASAASAGQGPAHTPPPRDPRKADLAATPPVAAPDPDPER